MMGSDKSQGHCLEMICADFWPEQSRHRTAGRTTALDFLPVQVSSGRAEAGIRACAGNNRKEMRILALQTQTQIRNCQSSLVGLADNRASR